MENNHRLLFETKITPPTPGFNRKSMFIGGNVTLALGIGVFVLFVVLKLFPVKSALLIASPLWLLGLLFLILSFVKKDSPRLMWLYIYDDEIKYATSNGNGDFSLKPESLSSVRSFSKGQTFAIILNGKYTIPFLPEADPAVIKLKGIVEENARARANSKGEESKPEPKEEAPEDGDLFSSDLFKGE